jgi:hypothetical protein
MSVQEGIRVKYRVKHLSRVSYLRGLSRLGWGRAISCSQDLGDELYFPTTGYIVRQYRDFVFSNLTLEVMCAEPVPQVTNNPGKL